jgi:hypothetical protein
VDDQDDREYSRAPELEDLLSLCKALNAEGIRYVTAEGLVAGCLGHRHRGKLVLGDEVAEPVDADPFLNGAVADRRDEPTRQTMRSGSALMGTFSSLMRSGTVTLRSRTV